MDDQVARSCSSNALSGHQLNSHQVKRFKSESKKSASMSKHNNKYRHGCLNQNSDAESDLSIDFEDQVKSMHHQSQSRKSNGRRRGDSNQLSANKSVGGLSRKSRQEQNKRLSNKRKSHQWVEDIQDQVLIARIENDLDYDGDVERGRKFKRQSSSKGGLQSKSGQLSDIA